MQQTKTFFLIGIFLMPIFQGLYFLHEAFAMGLMAALLLICVIATKKVLWLDKGYYLLFWSALFLLYTFSTFFGVNRGMAFLGGLKYLSYLLFYLLWVQLYEEGFRKKALTLLVYSLSITALMGILAFFIPFLQNILIQKGRLGGTLQYANTYGLICIVAFLWLLFLEEKKWWDYLAMGTLLCGLYLTMSRSMLLLGIAAILVGILLQIIERHKWAYSLLTILVSAFFTLYLVWNLQITEILRVTEVSTQTSEFATRLLYYKDAVNMMISHPTGTGYMGYQSIQRAYQTGSTYYIKFVHSHLLQVILDVGLLGGILWVIYFAKSILSPIRLQDKLIVTVVFAHGLIDFDFEFPIVLIFLILVTTVPQKREKIRLRTQRLTAVGVLLSILLLYFSLATGLNYYKLHREALGMYPAYTEAKMWVINSTSLEERVKLCQSIVDGNPYQVEAHAFLRDYYFHQRDYQKALKYAKKTMQINPLDIKQVEMYSSVLLEYSEDALSKKDDLLAKDLLLAVLQIPQELSKLAKEKATDLNVMHQPDFKMNQKLTVNETIARKLYSDLESKSN